MNKSDFYYDLPEELIAQHPAEKRDGSRLMKLYLDNDNIDEGHFSDIVDCFKENDCLILNNTRVLPARIYGIKETGARVEFLLLNRKEDDIWECIAGPGRKAKPGDKFTFGENVMQAEVLEVLDGGNRLVKFQYENNFYEALDKVGEMPLPHYITEKLEDKERYQTVYSKELGSAAAPTVGLHFTNELLEKIAQKGVKIGYITLHVGLGTFRPVKVDVIEEHKMHSEHYSVPEETAKIIEETKQKGGRVIAVGTTCCRTLESVAQKYDKIIPCDGWTDIFIYPPYKFKCIDGLITNFHLPESTLIMLVSAFYGYDKTMKAYNEAVKRKFRFFSFGDSMCIM